MKFLRLSVIVGLILAVPICASIYIGVDRLEKSAPRIRELRAIINGTSVLPTFEELMRQHFPVERKISNLNQVKLDAVVLGRSKDEIRFFSKTDGRNHNYPIEKLSEKDRDFALDLPISMTPNDEYPSVRHLASEEGTSRMVIIYGRTSFDLFFREYGEDGNEEVIAISQLAPADRSYVFGLPINR